MTGFVDRALSLGTISRVSDSVVYSFGSVPETEEAVTGWMSGLSVDEKAALLTRISGIDSSILQGVEIFMMPVEEYLEGQYLDAYMEGVNRGTVSVEDPYVIYVDGAWESLSAQTLVDRFFDLETLSAAISKSEIRGLLNL